MFIVNQRQPDIPADLLARLAQTSPGTIGHFRDAGFMDSGLAARMEGAKIAGTAVTLRVPVPDSSIVHYALKLVRPGDILVIERGPDQHVACWGGMTATAAARLGVCGVIIDGAGHDIAACARVGLPMWCRRIVPVTTKHRGIGGELNVPISCGGVVVSPGDAILADDNGIVVVPRVELAATVEEAISFDARKAKLAAALADDPSFVWADASGATRIVEEALARQSA